MLFLSNSFPFKTVIEAEAAVRKRLRASLPPKDLAYAIYHTYYSRLSWSYVLLRFSENILIHLSSTSPHFWTDFMTDVFNPVYTDTDQVGDDRVALVFVVLACACLLDPDRPANPPEARQFFHLSRVSIMLGEVCQVVKTHFIYLYLTRTYSSAAPYMSYNTWYSALDVHKSLASSDYQQYMAFYYGLSNEPHGTDKAWVATSLAIRLAQMVGTDSLSLYNDVLNNK